PKTADEMMELARRLGVVLSDDELRRAIEAGWNQTAYEQYMEELVWGPQRRANERGVRGQVLPDLLTPGAFGVGGMDWGQFASEAGGAMDKAAEDAEDLVEKTKEAAEAAKYWADNEELLVEYTQTLAGLHDTMTSPKTIWQEAEGSLSDYLAKMDEVIAAWDKFETNLIQLAEQYGPEFGADVIMAAAEQGPEYVAALVGSDPEVVRRALGQLQKLLTKDMDGLALAVAEASGTAGGTTAQSYVEAWTDHFKAQAAYLEQSVKETLPTDGSTEGALLGTSYANAFLTRMQNTLSGLGLFGGTAGVFPGPTVGTRLPGTHDVGGPLPHGTVAINMSGATEYVVTEDLPREIQNLIGELRSDLGPDGDLVRSIMSAFGERSSIAGSYISRERSRYGMLEAEGAPLERLEEVLLDQIRFISEAVAEAEAQLAAAKAEGLPAEEINDLAENLYDLREDAAKARKELDELADDGIDPLAQAADEASGRLDMLDSLFGMLSQSSSHMAQALGLIPEMLGAAQTELNSYIDLMNAATDATDRFDYGQRAIGSIETMFGIERQAIDTAMREELDTLEEWRDRTQAELSRRADSLARAGETMSAAMQTSRERLRAEQQKDMAELTAHYDEQLALMDEQDRELERRKVASELQSLYNAQALSASDLDRIQNLREQQRQQDRADARKTLQDQRDAAIKALQEQQEIEQQKLESQLETQEKTLEAQQRALDEAQRKADAYYDDQRRLIEDNAQQQIDLAVEKYAKEIEIIMAMATDVTGAITEMTGAVMDSALAKVDTTLSGGGSGVGAGGGWPADIGAVPTGQMTVAEYQALIAGVDNYAQKAALQNLYYGQAHLYDQLGVYKTGSHPGSDYEWDPHLGMEGGWKKVNEASHQATIDQAWESFYGNAKQYDDGGWLMPGVTLAVNKTGLPERVVPGGSHDSLDINLHISTDGPITDAQVGRIAGVLEELGREQYAARYNY
ncbi:MAG: hypothetical protein JW990_21250, partial [Thermoleophilia bacterium]|nr:hypothetical protein [Thermoleophilia bacterium]